MKIILHKNISISGFDLLSGFFLLSLCSYHICLIWHFEMLLLMICLLFYIILILVSFIRIVGLYCNNLNLQKSWYLYIIKSLSFCLSTHEEGIKLAFMYYYVVGSPHEEWMDIYLRVGSFKTIISHFQLIRNPSYYFWLLLNGQ